ncbi:flagellar motor protein MotB [Peribacillus asahii]|uniref:Flagellar motor protein MotB n=1 Tax=Peribacillus asahii TaxID=228899 RepID=A0A398BGE7_9BACI|nr:flagellar motor protein MotB [Peribacillus asahii]RID88694.1 flagellar motor protein MotB [Peribacillus asahii]
MARKKKKRNHEEHIDESWLVPYADILTLLLALFIVLFASSSIDSKKFNSMSNYFNQVFTGGTGVMDFPSTTQMDNADSLERGGSGKTEQEELSHIQSKVNTYIENKELSDKLGTSLTDEGLLVTIRDNVLFESGDAEVGKENQRIARDISKLLVMNPPRSIVISGHTDNLPIKTNQFDSNWDLSVMRAVNFMKILLENDKLDPEWFSAKGFGEFKPVASNKTAEGRAKNRRVEILIVPRTNVDE